MCTKRDEANVPVTLSTRFVVCFDDAQASVFSSGSRIGLYRTPFETCDFAEIVLQLLFHGRSAIDETQKVQIPTLMICL